MRKNHGFLCGRFPARKAPRSFTEADAARIICNVVGSGASTLTRIVARAKKQCPDTGEDSQPTADAAANIAEAALLESNLLLEDSYRFFLVINGILLVLSFATVFLPGPLRLLRPAARAAAGTVGVLITRNIQQRAANDAAYQILRALATIRRAA